MATSLTSIKLMQRLSASVQGLDSGGGIQSSIPIGGTNNTALTTTDADLMYSFEVTWSADTHVATWTLQTGAVVSDGGTCIVTGVTGSTSGAYDVNGVALPNAVTIVAIYYEAPAGNAGDVTVVPSASAHEFGTMTFKAAGSKQQSCLITPRVAHGSKTITLGNSTGASILKVVCLAKDGV